MFDTALSDLNADIECRAEIDVLRFSALQRAEIAEIHLQQNPRKVMDHLRHEPSER
jgi:hypothetical protein